MMALYFSLQDMVQLWILMVE